MIEYAGTLLAATILWHASGQATESAALIL